MKAHRAEFPLTAICRVLGLSPSRYYDWLKRPPSERARRYEALRGRIEAVWKDSRETYGRPRIPWEGTTELISDTINHRNQPSVTAGQVQVNWPGLFVSRVAPSRCCSTGRSAPARKVVRRR